jgi:hypothetical protein
MAIANVEHARGIRLDFGIECAALMSCGVAQVEFLDQCNLPKSHERGSVVTQDRSGVDSIGDNPPKRPAQLRPAVLYLESDVARHRFNHLRATDGGHSEQVTAELAGFIETLE